MGVGISNETHMTAFPKDIIEQAIRDELKAIAADMAGLHGQMPGAGCEPEVDSQNVLRILCRIEEETGLYVSEDCVPPGGFDDVEACVAAILTHAEATWTYAKEKAE